MSHIAYLIENDKQDELLEEVSGCAISIGKTPEEVAKGFTDAYHNIRLQKNNPAFAKLNEIQDEMLDVGVQDFLEGEKDDTKNESEKDV